MASVQESLRTRLPQIDLKMDPPTPQRLARYRHRDKQRPVLPLPIVLDFKPIDRYNAAADMLRSPLECRAV